MIAEERDRFITIKEMQQRLQIGKTKAWMMINNRTIPAVRIGRVVRIRVADLEKYLSENPY